MKKAPALSLGLFALSSLFCLYTFFHEKLMGILFTHGTYYILLALILFWVVILYDFSKKNQFSLLTWIKGNQPALWTSAILTATLLISEPPYFRILMDETNLISVSKSMFHNRTIQNILNGYWENFHYFTIDTSVPIRPALFPFFIHLLHLFLGYQASNAFILNGVALFGFFLMIFSIFQRNFGKTWAIGTCILVAAQPLVTLGASSAGFDFFFVFFMFLAFVSLQTFIKKPQSISFQLLWIHLLLLCHIRYESPMFLFSIVGILFLLKYLKIHFFDRPWLFGLSPLFLAPLFWQQLISGKPYDNLEAPAFSISYLFKHFKDNLETIFRYDFYIPTAPILSIIGLVAILFFSILFLTRRWPSTQKGRHLFAASSVPVILLCGLYHAYFFGDLTHPTSSRFFTLFFIFFSIFTALLVHYFKIFSRKPYLFILFSCVFFILCHPIAENNRFLDINIRNRHYRVLLDYFKDTDMKKNLVISSYTNLHTSQNWSAINYNYANQHPEAILQLLKNHSVQNIYVVQEIYFENQAPSEEQKLSETYKLEPVFKLQNTGWFYIQISRVKNFDSID